MNDIAWDHGPHIRIRQATPEDLAAIRELAPQAGEGVELEQPIVDAVTKGFAADALRVGLHESISALHRKVGALLERSNNPLSAYMHVALALVAEHEDHGVIGTLLAYPPIRVVEPFRDVAITLGGSPLVGVTDLVKVKAVVVAESARGGRIGSELLRRCRQIYFGCDYKLIYGQIEPSAQHLERFYRKRGFTVLDVDESIPLHSVFGFNAHLTAEDGQRMFMRERIH
jgi:N-acetylglutamate synthase-like GNAT family acetyltransferase